MALNIGINVMETDGSTSPALAGAATSTAGFCLPTARGVPNRPLFVTSMAEYRRSFAGPGPGTVSDHLVRGFFGNGGTRAWLSRVVASGATAGTGTLRQGSGGGTAELLDVTAGQRGSIDPGPWSDGYRLTVAPSFVTAVADGAALTATTAPLGSVSGLGVGTPVCVAHGPRRHLATVATLDAVKRTITWAPAIDAAQVDEFKQAGTTVSTLRCNAAVVDPAGEVVENFPDVSFDEGDPRYVVAVLASPSQGSRFVTATDHRAAGSRVSTDAPTAIVEAVLDGGAANAPGAADFAGGADDGTGIHAFDAIDIQLLTIASSDRTAVAAALDYCQQRDDCMFVGSVPQGSVASGEALEYGAALQGAKVYGALYGPWIRVLDPDATSSDPTVWVPPSGHVMGVYARIESSRGIAKAPAGDEARVLGALEVETALSDVQHTDLVERGTVNGIRFIPGAGIVIDASRTLSTDTRWRYVNVRLLFNYVKSSLKLGLRWVRQEPNRDTLWTAVKYGSVRPFLLGLWRQGAFGAGEPDQVFTIVCDATNNPPDQVDLGIFTLDVTFYPSRPAEKIAIRVGQQASGATTSER